MMSSAAANKRRTARGPGRAGQGRAGHVAEFFQRGVQHIFHCCPQTWSKTRIFPSFSSTYTTSSCSPRHHLCCFVVVCATHYMACRQGKHNWISMASVKNHAYATPAAAPIRCRYPWMITRSSGPLALPPSAVCCPTIALNAMKPRDNKKMNYKPKLFYTYLIKKLSDL